MSVIARLQKRQKFDVSIGDETVSVKEMPVEELRTLDDKIPDVLLRSYYIIGRCLVDDDPQLEVATSETETQYAERIRGLLAGMGSATLAQLTTAITKLGTIPKQEKLQKN